MYKQLFQFAFSADKGTRLLIITLTTVAGISHGLLLTVINEGVEQIVQVGLNPILLGIFISLLGLYLWANYYALSRSIILVRHMIKDLRLRLCNKLLQSNLREIELLGKGEIYTQLTQDADALSRAAMTILNSIQAATLIIFCLAYIGWLSLAALSASLLAIVVGILAYQLQVNIARALLQDARSEQNKFYDALQDLLNGFKELRMTQIRADAMQQQLKQHALLYHRLETSAEIKFMISFLTAQSAILLLLGFMAFIFPAYFNIDSTTLYKFVATVLFLSAPLEILVTSIPNIVRGRIALERLYELEERLSIRDVENKPDIKLLETTRTDLTLDNIHYTYGTTDDNDNFSIGPLSIYIPQATITFIIGGNGSGKTTLLKIIAGLYEPDSGVIRLGDRTIQTGRLDSYREQFSIVFHDFHLFKLIHGITIDPEIINHLLETVSLQDKTHYYVSGFSNLNLSAGQRKRLAYIAALMYDRKIFLFDEFAADQDPEFRQYIYTTLFPQLRDAGKTVIVITHDDAYFHCCDKLYKLDCGQLIPHKDERLQTNT